jgi:hypothetical protein
MIRGALGSRYGISPLGRGVIRPASGGWWLSGGIAAANCIAAYQAKGAADYAASKVNLANPGTYNAADGAANPTWDGTNGWKFDATSSQYLNSGVTPEDDRTWSAIIRFSNDGLIGYSVAYGCRIVSPDVRFGLSNAWGTTHAVWSGAQSTKYPPGKLSNGVHIIAGEKSFYNKTEETGTFTSSSVSFLPIYIGCWNQASTAANFATLYIQAFAIYDVDISSYVNDLTDAINAL